MADKLKLFVNGEEVEVEQGGNLIDALSAVGIEIPHFCYHPALGADGNCRMCLVGIEDGRPPLVPACKTPAAEGMKVLIDAEHIRKIQHDVMEFELINHPVDCPVCDQAGECTLQDYYMKYDAEPTRMRVEQVKKGKKMDFGAGVVHDQERCVLCARCVRFCRQITGTGELGIVNRTDAARVTIFPGRPLNNRYALNVVDLCPVGAMTSKDFRFKQRVWFLKKDKSICHGCSKGCNIYIDHNREKYKDDLIYRFRPRPNAQVNGYFICDEGRLGYRCENEGRLEQAQKKSRKIDLAEAVELAQKTISQASAKLVLVSPDMTLEQMAAAQAYAESIGALVSGYSDSWIKEGDGDDYLIKDDKAANRAGLAQLGIDASPEKFGQWLEDADLVISCNNDFTADKAQKGWSKRARDTRIVFLSTHKTPLASEAEVSLPLASYSEYGGCVINCDGILQSFAAAVVKNEPAPDLIGVLHILGSPVASLAAARELLKNVSGPLGSVDFSHIPEEGLKLS